MTAHFITLDGIDGAGKTTQLTVIREWFAAQGRPVLFTREPGGTPLGEALRRLLLNPKTQAGLRAETLLMFAARAQHIESVILPALEAGVSVVSVSAAHAEHRPGNGLAKRGHRVVCTGQLVLRETLPRVCLFQASG